MQQERADFLNLSGMVVCETSEGFEVTLPVIIDEVTGSGPTLEAAVTKALEQRRYYERPVDYEDGTN